MNKVPFNPLGIPPFDLMPSNYDTRRESGTDLALYNNWQFSASAVDAERARLAKVVADYQPPAPLPQKLDLKIDPALSCKELGDLVALRLAEVGLQPSDVLIRVVDQEYITHTSQPKESSFQKAFRDMYGLKDTTLPTAGSLEDVTELALALGFDKWSATWVRPFYPGGKNPIPSWSAEANSPHNVGKGLIIFRKDALHNINRIGEKDVRRDFWVFKGNPHDAVIGLVHNYGAHDLKTPLTRKPSAGQTP